jgi:antitoxin (DNA-binding transcriptional repressor) of toxin-antitoxin stability system
VPRRIEIFVNSLIVGFHCDSRDPLVSTASVAFQHLTEWWGHSGIEHDFTVTAPDLAVRYTSPAPFPADEGRHPHVGGRGSGKRFHDQQLIAAIVDDLDGRLLCSPDRVSRGDEFVVARGGKLLAALIPAIKFEVMIRAARRRALASLKQPRVGTLTDTQAMELGLEAQRWARKKRQPRVGRRAK